MVTVPILRAEESTQTAGYTAAPLVKGGGPASQKGSDWTQYVAAGVLIIGGGLMATGRKKAGMTVAVAGTAIAALDQQEALKVWWKSLPEFLGRAQEFLDHVDEALAEASAQGQRIQNILRR